MDRLDIGIIGVVVALFLIVLRVQVGVALGIVAFFGIAAITSTQAAWGLLTALPHDFVAQWSLSAVPMFLLMGYLAAQTGLTNGLFSSARILIGRVPGGLASATVVASALFASASGSSIATAAAFARIAVPEMLRARYSPALATGCVAAAGTLGSLIPPSVLMILYGIFTDTSIGALFVGGVIPGVLSAAMYIAMISLRARRNPAIAPPDLTAYSREERRAAFHDVWPLPVLIGGVLGGIFLGIISPTEGGAVGAGLTALIALSRRSLTLRAMRGALVETALGTSSIFIIAIGASMFAVFMGLSSLPNAMAGLLLDHVSSRLAIIAAMALLVVIMGMFVDAISLLLLTIPIMLPVLRGLDIDLVWFGIIMIKLLEIGLLTPPVGMNVFVIKSALGRTVELSEIFKGAMWFIVTDLVTLALLIAFPAITLFLPALMR